MRKKIKIVIAGDRPGFRDGLCRQLTLEEDFEVVAQVQDAYQALDTLRNNGPDILLLDSSIPHADAETILLNLQAARSRTRVIVVTGSEEKSELVMAMKFRTALSVSKMAGELLVEGVRKVHAGKVRRDSRATKELGRQLVAIEDALMSPPPPSAPHDWKELPLSRSEREIVSLVVQGYKNKEIAELSSVSERTIQTDLRTICYKLGVADRIELFRLWLDNFAGGQSVPAGGGGPRLPHRPPLSASAEPPADPYGSWITDIPPGPRKSGFRRE